MGDMEEEFAEFLQSYMTLRSADGPPASPTDADDGELADDSVSDVQETDDSEFIPDTTATESEF